MGDPWISTRDSVFLMRILKGGVEGVAEGALLTLLKSGALTSVAGRYDGNPPNLPADCTLKHVEDGDYFIFETTSWPLTRDFWGLIQWRGQAATADWDLGIFAYSFSPRSRPYRQFENATAVVFDAAELQSVIGNRIWHEHADNPERSASRAQPSVPINKGGRPPAAFADELMCAVWASIYRGDFKPRRQADVERAIKDWVIAQGHDLGDTTAREKARKIWTAINEDVENPVI